MRRFPFIEFKENSKVVFPLLLVLGMSFAIHLDLSQSLAHFRSLSVPSD